MNRYQLDAYAALEEVQQQFSVFLRGSFRFRNPVLDEKVHRTIRDLGLLAPTVVEATFPYDEPTEAPRNLKELAEAGIVHKELPGLLARADGDARWPETRPLYTHQVTAVRRYREGKSLVVSSGTGSGKTEAFLFPAIDSVLNDEDLTRPGVRVLVVYPLNALVNNQMDRLRAILGHHPTIRFALYTRRLAHTQREAERKLERAGRPRYPAEIISREALRASPPHILVTNFSMLEYALVRPADAPIFSPTFVHPRLVVLDEAHVYAGAMAAEITLLLRRAWLRWGVSDPASMQGIVTSATMHQGVADGLVRLRDFATKLLSKTDGSVVDISGHRVLTPDATPTITAAAPEPAVVARLDLNFPTLREVVERDAEGQEHRSTVFDESQASKDGARAAIEAVRPEAPKTDLPAARQLWEALEPLEWVRTLRSRLHKGRAVRIDEIAEDLFPAAADEAKRAAAHKLLGLLALARPTPTGLPLLPVRLHAIARGPHGIFACINASCDRPSVPGRLGQLFTDHVDRCSCGGIACELRVCEACGQSYLAAQSGVDDENVAVLQPVGSKEVDLYVPGDAWDDGAAIDGGQPKYVFASGDGSGRFAPAGDGVKFRMFPGGRLVGATRQLVGIACPRCEARLPSGGILRRIESGTDAALQVLIDGLYPELPEHKDADAKRLRGGGRRALLFADNRQVAAALAAKIEESHDLRLSRVILTRSVRTASEGASSPEAERLYAQLNKALAKGDDQERDRILAALRVAAQRDNAQGVEFRQLVRQVADDEHLRELSCHDPDQTQALAWMIVARELGRRPARTGNLEANGVIAVEYTLSLTRPTHPDVAAAFPEGTWRALVELILDLTRTSGSVTLPDIARPFDQYVMRSRHNKLLVKEVRGAADGDENDEDEDGGGGKVALVPGPRYQSRRLEFVTKVLAKISVPATVVPRLVLTQIWECLEAAARVEGSCLKLDAETRTPALRLPMPRLRFRVAEGERAWRCPVCRTVWARQVANVCPTAQCEGVLVSTEGASVDARDRLVALARSSAPLLGMSTEEHTAQIGSDELETFEQRFKAGELNVLVCSTTMELGIDIGGLSATLLTNVPPGPSNYLQRAGRAGRRAEGTSLVMTFARPRPFELAAFEEPDRPFKDRIVPPTVQLDSRRIVLRHANAFLLAHFFRRYRAQADAKDPMSSLRSVGEFFDSTLQSVLGGTGELAKLVADVDVAPNQATLSDAFVSWLRTALAEAADVMQGLAQLVAGTVLATDNGTQIAERAACHMKRIADNVRSQLAILRNERAEEDEKPVDQQDDGLMKALALQEEDLRGEKLLGFLAEEQFLPRYGFPIQVVPLHDSYEYPKRGERRAGGDESGLRLARDIALALNEYAPGAEVVAQKHVHRSSGIVRHWTGTDAPGVFSARYVAICGECGRFQHARTQAEVRSPCPTCKVGDPRSVPVILPKQGFAVKWGVAPRRWTSGIKPPLRPVTESAYAVRDGEAVVEVSPALALAYDEEGQILVRTEGQLDPTELPGAELRGAGAPRAGFGYAICYLCGRAEPETQAGPDPETKTDPLPKPLTGHRRLRGSHVCEATSQFWRHMALAGAVRTETLNVQLRAQLEFPVGADGRRLATTWMVALQLAAGELLGIDSRQIGGLLVPRSVPRGFVNDVLLYDQIAGGAGHCRALRERWPELLDTALARLSCGNTKCVNGCHRCLIAFETQRYEDMLRRGALRAFLEPRWQVLKEQPRRDGVAVGALFRGGAEIRETLGRGESGVVTAFAPSIAPDALDEDAWLPLLLRHSEGRGRVRLVVEQLPDPDSDTERFLAARLRLAIAGGRFDLLLAKKGGASLPWCITLSDPARAFFVEDAQAEGLGEAWFSDASVYEAMTDASRRTILERVEKIVSECRRAGVDDVEPEPPAEKTVVHKVAAGESGPKATFDAWFRGPSGVSLFSAPLAEVTIADPYLATEWQLKLLSELATLVRRAGCDRIRVDTYAPREEGAGFGINRTVTPDEQQRAIGAAIGDANTTAMGWACRSGAAKRSRVGPCRLSLTVSPRFCEG